MKIVNTLNPLDKMDTEYVQINEEAPGLFIRNDDLQVILKDLNIAHIELSKSNSMHAQEADLRLLRLAELIRTEFDPTAGISV